MLVRCPKCSKKLKVQDEKVGESGLKFRCPVCKGIFLVRKPVEVPSAPQPEVEFRREERPREVPAGRDSELSGFSSLESSSEPGEGTVQEEENSGTGLANPLSGWSGGGGAGDKAPGREWGIDTSSIAGVTEAGASRTGLEDGSQEFSEEPFQDSDQRSGREWELDESLISGAVGASETMVEDGSENIDREAAMHGDSAPGKGSQGHASPNPVTDETRAVDMGEFPSGPEEAALKENDTFEDASHLEVERARRLARTIISDIALYNSRMADDAIRNDTFFDVLGDEIREGMKLYNSRISPEVRGTSDFYREAVEDFYHRRRRELSGP